MLIILYSTISKNAETADTTDDPYPYVKITVGPITVNATDDCLNASHAGTTMAIVDSSSNPLFVYTIPSVAFNYFVMILSSPNIVAGTTYMCFDILKFFYQMKYPFSFFSPIFFLSIQLVKLYYLQKEQQHNKCSYGQHQYSFGRKCKT